MVYLSTRKGRRMSNYSDCRQRLTLSRNQATEEWWEVGLPRAKTGNWCSNSHHFLVISHSSLKQHVSYKSNDVSLTLPRGSDAPRVQKPRDVYWWNCNRQHHSPGKATNHCTWQGKPREAGEVMCPALPGRRFHCHGQSSPRQGQAESQIPPRWSRGMLFSWGHSLPGTHWPWLRLLYFVACSHVSNTEWEIFTQCAWKSRSHWGSSNPELLEKPLPIELI